MIDTATPYTHDAYMQNSTLVGELFYDEDTSQLVVVLKEGNAYAYGGVPLEVFNAFANIEKLGGSAGRYYNDFIKNGGFQSLGPVDVETLEDRNDDGELDYNEDRYVSSGFTSVGDVTKATPVNITSNVFTGGRNEYSVNFTDDNFEASELSLYASNEDEAKSNFEQIATLAGWENVSIQSITRHF